MSWSAATLGDVVERDGGLIQTGPFGSQLHQSDYVTEGIPVIMPKDIADGRVDAVSVARVSEQTASRLSRHQLRPRTIVLPRRGEITKRAFIRDDQAGWLCGTGCLQIMLEGKHLLPEFLYYYMEQQAVVRWLEQHAVGTTMLNLSAGIVTELPLKYPAPVVQRRIAGTLSAYDDLIENNRRRIQLLEQAARLLYKEWFVHLRFPGHEHVPVKDGVPEGWRRTTVGSMSSFISRGITPKYDDEAQGIVINQKCIRHQRVDMRPVRHQAKPVPPEKVVRYGDVLINSTGAGTLGRVAQFLAFVDDCTVDSHVTISRPADGAPPHLYGQQVAAMESLLATMGRGATNQTELSKDAIAEISALEPTHPLAEQFEAFAGRIARQVQNLTEQNTRLAQARDLLLPRLMSGEIVV